MPPKKIKIQLKTDKPQFDKNIIKVEKLSPEEEDLPDQELPEEELPEELPEEELQKDDENKIDVDTNDLLVSIIKPSKSIKDPEIKKKEVEIKKKEVEVKKKEVEIKKKEVEVKKKEVEVKKKEPEVKKKEPEVKKKEVEVKKTQSIQSTPANASRPKIEEAIQTNNTVDMFDEDDLDFRTVMMNYDYTKNKTAPRITKYEKALLIGKRATQLEWGATPNIKINIGQSVISIAEEELRQRKIPLIIKRPIGNTFEYWKPAHMEVNMD